MRRRSKMVTLKLDERSDMGKLADQIMPQLNSMQKNLLGLLFFNELSENIVEDLVTQQLDMMPSHQFAQTLATLDREVKERWWKMCKIVLSDAGDCSQFFGGSSQRRRFGRAACLPSLPGT